MWLTERGFVQTNGDYKGYFKAAWQIVILANCDIKSRLIAIGDALKEKYKDEFEKIKSPYIEEALKSVPKHFRRIKEYELQFLFSSDGWFLCHCITALLKNGKLKLPTENQKKSITTLIFPN